MANDNPYASDMMQGKILIREKHIKEVIKERKKHWEEVINNIRFSFETEPPTYSVHMKIQTNMVLDDLQKVLLNSQQK